jgi:UDP-N-acetylmuramate--alanine ligase
MTFKAKNIYFVGIGGIGMSAIARYFKHMGCFVAGYDLTKTELTDRLQNEGISINYEDNIALINDIILEKPHNSIIIYTPAIPQNNNQLNYFKNKGYNIFKRAEILGELSRNQKTIAVAGTHGKTTISSIVTHVFMDNQRLRCSFVGGIMKNYKSNFVVGNDSENNYMILEADEFDRSFLNFYPQLSILSATDSDHLDIYGKRENILDAFRKFVSQTSEYAIINENADVLEQDNVKILKYGIKKNNDFYADNVKAIDGKQVFDIIYPKGKCKNISIKMPGSVSIENSLAAFAIAWLAGIESENIKKSLSSFAGIERRFDVIFETEKVIYINDYAHHPTEIDRLFEAVEQLYPNMKKTAVFQPHLYSRTRDFASGFADSLNRFDEVFLLDIYPARELPIEGVGAEMILEMIQNTHKSMCGFEDIVDILKNKQLQVLLTIGAGSIDNLVKPIKKMIEEKYDIFKKT